MLSATQVDRLIEKAVGSADGGDHAKAIPLFEALVADGLVAFNLNLGLSLLELGRLSAAKEAFIVGAAAGLDDCKYELALLIEDEGDTESARAIFRDLAGQGDRDAAFALGMSFSREHDSDEAIALLTPLIDGDDEAARASAGIIGTLLLAKGKVLQAVPLLRRGATTYPPAQAALDELANRR